MINLLDYFDAAYVINLPERVDRRKSLMEEFARINWPVGPGGVEIIPAIKLEDRAGFPSAAVRSCFLSHVYCLEKAHRQGCKTVLVMEDDIAFSPAFSRLSSRLLSRLTTIRWDFVYLGHDGAGDIGYAGANTQDLQMIAAPREITGAHFYCVSANVLPRLLQHLDRAAHGKEGDSTFGPMPVDGAFNIFRRIDPVISAFMVTPKLGWQRPSRSDITPKRLDIIPRVRFVMSGYRLLKQAVLRWRRSV